jgi:WD40 repeat protein
MLHVIEWWKNDRSRQRNSPTYLAWTHDGSQMLVIHDGYDAVLWDADPTHQLHGGVINACYGRGGKWAFAVAEDGTIRVANLSTSTDSVSHSFWISDMQGCNRHHLYHLPTQAAVMSLTFVHDKNLLAIVQQDGLIHVFDTLNGTLVRTIQSSGNGLFSPDGSKFAVGGKGGVWDIVTGQKLPNLENVVPLVWSLDGKQIVTSESTDAGITLRWQDTLTGHVQSTLSDTSQDGS